MITKNESKTISWLRALSMILIVICHICQAYSNYWAFVFNIGVQIFLVLSGVLYGNKIITDWRYWIFRRINRVYLPMLVLLFIMLPVYLLLQPSFFSGKIFLTNIFNLQGFLFALGGGMLSGVRHLWFITAIFMNYIITPLLQRYKTYADVLMCIGVSLMVLGYFLLPGSIAFILSWIFLYSMGYLYISSKHQKKWLIIITTIALIAMLICMLYGWSSVTQYFNPVGRCLHDFGGICLVLLPLSIIKAKNVLLPQFISFFDKYSYHIYLIHYIFIIGPFSIAYRFDNILLNVIAMLLLTAIGTFLFCIINNIIIYWINKFKISI